MDPSPSVPSPSLFDLTGQNVLLTGASRGQSHTSLYLRDLISPLVPVYSGPPSSSKWVYIPMST